MKNLISKIVASDEVITEKIITEEVNTGILNIKKSPRFNKKILLYFVLFLVAEFAIMAFYVAYRPGFIKVKSSSEELKTIMISGFANINKRFDRQVAIQDSINQETRITMQRVPKIFPVPGAKISSFYGETRDSVRHWGLDISNKKGAPIYAPISGIVTQARWDDGYGNRTILDSGRFKVTIAHQDKMYVAEGQAVEQGQLIGTVGNTGNSTGAHEHIEIEQDGKRRDPKPFMQ
jgi:murein DD-endopeptidase MepM/ murein hydrolase activator NlpD